MNLLHLKYALEIARTCSISKAAENLFMGQPNLSRAIKELEAELGVTIFNRTTKGITITVEGERFLQYAKRIMKQVEEMEDVYKNGKYSKQRFSVCVPRASYISQAVTKFARHIRTDIPTEIYYRETNSNQAINGVVTGDCDLGIIRYQQKFEKYFESLFLEKHLTSETIMNFKYVLLMSKKHELAQREQIFTADLKDYIEISHADPYVPSLSQLDAKKEELSQSIDKHFFVFERGSQFELLENITTTFMWVSPIPQETCEKYGLVQLPCADNTRVYKDVLIYRDDYRLAELDELFVEAVWESKKKNIDCW